MPAKGDAARPPSPAPKFRRPDAIRVQAAARALFASPARRYGSQASLLAALLESLREEEPLTALGGVRMRRLLLETKGVRLRVSYSQRSDRRPLDRCPVCAGELRALRNRTLDGDSVTLGYACPRCAYWTHRERRVPVRYEFYRARGAPRRAAADPPTRSG